MAEVLANLLLRLVWLLVGVIGWLEPSEPAAGPGEVPVSLVGSAAQPSLLPVERRSCTVTPASSSRCHAARMRWQVTLPGPMTHRCADRSDCDAG
jgi:hypothetical protein